ncbi:hypothetical protein D3C85_366060 [compost metagenome]
MKKLILLVFSLILFVQCKIQENPFSEDIKKFQNYDKDNAPQKDIVLFIGSSTFTLWGENIKKDFSNDAILNRAFGASSLLDLIHYKEEILFAYQPKKIIIYCGENDIANVYPKVKGEEVAKRFKKLFQNIRSQFPDIPVVYLSIKPSIARWEMRGEMMIANQFIEEYLKTQHKGYFVNIWNLLLDQYGNPNRSLYLEDELHLNMMGYKILTDQLEQYVNNE